MQKVRGRTLPEGHSAPTACRRHGFRYYFTPLAGVLFTFPSRYLFTIGRWVVFSLGRWSSRIPAGFHVSCGTWGIPRESDAFRLQGCYLLWRAFPDPSATRLLCDSLRAPQRSRQAPTTPNAQRLRAYIRSVWAVPRSLAATRGIATCFLFLRLLRWFSSPRWPLAAYEFSGGCVGIAPRRFPDSEIPGSKPVSGSPRLIAAVHVLLRLPAPRHPPCALSSLTVSLRRTPIAATGAPLRSRSRTGYHLV